MDNFLEMAVLGEKSFDSNLVQPSSRIFNHALSFYRAYLKLKVDGVTSNPSHVCLVFAIELFLKCLETKERYTKQDTYTEGSVSYKVCHKPIPRSAKHDLEELFQKLSKNTQEAIALLYKKEYGGDFYTDLVLISKGFIEWRYIYEGNVEVVHVWSLQKIGDFLFNNYSQSVFENN
ncbi:hypothetical protein DTO96_101800 [Ephemeroptericola cinctiostellae]|uniref:HEPN domain-containing protein n=1 Tax=Ephemeroptericola cinctiostellae TaxID=2268024 RepID=A0A345DCH1_9BURK|nr:hypothetical protein [Ephemeroptericola cinctiostellae]AXF86059.1 hypothetical protein DTO96_101800 [Ephemeroptericola cinctiostellae]